MKITQEQKEMAVKMARENQMEHGMSCSESVFNALIRSGIIDLPEDYTRIATGLSGGVAASGNTCGAIYGGLMALGWVYGRKNPFEKPQAPDPARRLQLFKRVFHENILQTFWNCLFLQASAFFLFKTPSSKADTTVPTIKARRYITAFPTTGNTKIPP